MKLRNKKTGEIAEPFGINCVNGRTFVRFDDGKGTFKFEARSLAEFNEEWEDYEEPKEFWVIDAEGRIKRIDKNDSIIDSSIKRAKEIGNYFETEEEAEKAVEKLKAWKRLKDKGFKFERWTIGGEYGNTITFSDYIDYNDETRLDLDLLFGGEE